MSHISHCERKIRRKAIVSMYYYQHRQKVSDPKPQQLWATHHSIIEPSFLVVIQLSCCNALKLTQDQLFHKLPTLVSSKLFMDQCCDTKDELAVCDASIVIRVPAAQFWSSFGLMHLGNQWKMVHLLRTVEFLLSCLGPGPALPAVAIWTMN